ncbi:MAG TPA: hypothetical protein VF704_13430 [Allosphingosinicella sp.]|jgi:Spy/CpxP family protein refolding chaperone
MRKLLASVALATVALTAVPAAAQHHQPGHHGWNHRGPARHAVAELLGRLDRVEQRINRSDRRGMISGREAFGLRREAVRIRQRLHRAGRDGLSGREFGELHARVGQLEQRLRFERRDRDGRRG